MIEFVCIGLDIRVSNPDQPFSADATVWEQEEWLYERAQNELNIRENSLQLLHPQDSSEISRLIELVQSSPNAVLIAFELPRKIYEVCPQAAGLVSPIHLNSRGWDLLGYDVCDINGFFSFLDMSGSGNKRPLLFDEEHLIDAFVLAQAANFAIREHSPFVVIRLKKKSVRYSGVGPS